MTEQKPPGMSWESWIDQQSGRRARPASSTTCRAPGSRCRTSPMATIPSGGSSSSCSASRSPSSRRRSRCSARSNPRWRPSGCSRTRPRSDRDSWRWTARSPRWTHGPPRVRPPAGW